MIKQIQMQLSRFSSKYSLLLLRYSLGAIFFWFGALKLLGISPIEELVSQTTDWMHIRDFPEILGVWEMCIGICFLNKKWYWYAFVLFMIQIPGTFLPLLLHPSECFTVFPYGLTLEGQYIFKNLILISAVFSIMTPVNTKKIV